MSRFLFVVPPLAGHVNPTLGVAVGLIKHGHEVAWAGVPELVRDLVGPQAIVFPCAIGAPGHGGAQRPPELRGPAALKFLWERFLTPMAEAMVPGVQGAVERFAPDVLIVDQQAVAGALVAERAGLMWATSATTSAELTDPLAGMPKVEAWVRELMADLRRRFGDPTAAGDLRFSPHLVLAFSTNALVGSTDHLGGHIRFVGPSIAPRPGGDTFPWKWLDAERSAVLCTLGTVNNEASVRFLNECVEALEATPDRQAVIVDPAGVLGAVPEHVLAQRAVPQLQLLPHVDAVVCHAGHNTVCETLSHGLPLVVAPIRDDQSIVAQQVVDAGAGIRLRFIRATAAQIGPAVEAVLTEPSFRQAARRVQESFVAAGGAALAAAHLEALASGGVGTVAAERATP